MQRFIERWRTGLTAPRTKNKVLTELYGVFRRAQNVYGLERNPTAQVENLRQRRRLELDVFTPEEVRALCRAAGTEQDAALYLTAAFTALRRGELIAAPARRRLRRLTHPRLQLLCRRPAHGAHERQGPLGALAHDVACVLAQRERWTADDDLVPSRLGGYLDASALRRRYLDALDAAGFTRLRFHDLGHTLGTAMIAKADILRVMEWMGHAAVQTTRGYLHSLGLARADRGEPVIAPAD